MNNLIYKYVLSDVGRVIWDSFDNDIENWQFLEYKMIHSTGVCIWTGNEGFFFNGYIPSKNPQPELGLIERHFLYKKAMRLKNKKGESNNNKVIELLRDRK